MSVRTLLIAGVISISGLAVGAGVFSSAEAALAPPETDSFSENLSSRFDRDIFVSGTDCAFGIKKADLCFKSSPLEKYLVKGEPLSSTLPAMPAEISVLREIGQSYDGHRIYRYGQTLVLIQDKSLVVADIIQFREIEANDAA